MFDRYSILLSTLPKWCCVSLLKKIYTERITTSLLCLADKKEENSRQIFILFFFFSLTQMKFIFKRVFHDKNVFELDSECF